MSSFIHITRALNVSDEATTEIPKSTELSPKPSELYLLENHVRNEFTELV
jgi:hypothetical protein